jgi:hypothetical protein
MPPPCMPAYFAGGQLESNIRRFENPLMIQPERKML